MPSIGLIALLTLCLAACGRDEALPSGVAALPPPTGPDADLPRLTAAPDDDVWLSWVEPRPEGGHRLRYSVLSDRTWGPGRTVAQGDGWFVNWADFPSVTPLAAGHVAAHWLVKRTGGTYAYDIAISISTDGGVTWSPSMTPHMDNTATEHGFVSLFSWEHDVGAVWLDGRMMTNGTNDRPDGRGSGAGGMTLRAGRVDAGAMTVVETELDGLVCDCCQTGAAPTVDGVVVVYRDRTDSEIRDISVVRLGPKGWSMPGPVAADEWRIDGCPVNGPAVDARDGRVAVAWFTGAGEPRVQATISEDGGRRFSTPVFLAGGAVLGRVDTVMLEDGSAVVSWLERAGETGAQIRYRRINVRGRTGPIRVVAGTSAARSAGFPQMTRGGDGLVFAWTRHGEPSGVEVVTVPLPPLSGG